MELPVYVTVEEVQRVCKELKIRDWTKLADAKVKPEEARVVLDEVNTEGMPIPLVDFVIGLEVELEHGTRFQDANVTNNHPILTGKIVLAHLKETMDYYQRLDVAELETAKDEYYRQAGWDPQTGNPTPETLARLGLEWIS